MAFGNEIENKLKIEGSPSKKNAIHNEKPGHSYNFQTLVRLAKHQVVFQTLFLLPNKKER